MAHDKRAPLNPTLFGQHWRHEKTGGTYTVLGTGYQEGDLTAVVIYRSDAHPGTTWVRPLDEFTDGRFKPITPAQVEAGA